MPKIKVVVWGITESIWKSITDKLDPRKTDICFFIDNNKQMEGTEFQGRQIYAFGEEVRKRLEEVDVVLITAYSGFQVIKKQLLESGLSSNKIQLYITKNILGYQLGDIGIVEREVLKDIYFEPEKRWSEIEQYQEFYKKYQNINKIGSSQTGGDEWYLKGSLISHACGGIVNDREFMYSNSKEALEYSFTNNFV